MGECLCSLPNGGERTKLRDLSWRSTSGPLGLEVWAELPAPADHVAVHPLDADQAWAVTHPGVLHRCVGGTCAEATPPGATVHGSHVNAQGWAFAAAMDGVWRVEA
jgi:hypothetical protein